MEFYYKNIASFTFSLWEIWGCHLGDSRFPVFRAFSLWCFSLFLPASFCHALSPLPRLLLLISLHLFLLSASSLSASLSPEHPGLKIPQRRPGQLLGHRAEQSFSLGWDEDKWLPLTLLPHLTQPGMASYRSLWSKAWQPVTRSLLIPFFKKELLSVASDPSIVNAIQTPSHYNDLFVVEHLLNHSTFSNTLNLFWAICMFRSKKCPFLENWWTKGNNSFVCFLEQNC